MIKKIQQYSYLIALLVLLVAYILLRFASARIEPLAESMFGVFPITQRWGVMSWLWGFRQTSPMYLSRWLLLLVFTLLPVILLTKIFHRDIWTGWVDHLSSRKRLLFFVVVALTFAGLFWVMRLKIAWGDYARYTDYMLRGILPGKELTPQPPTIFFMSSPLGTALFYAVWSILHTFGWQPEDTVAFANVMAGAIYIFSLQVLVHQWRGLPRLSIFAVLATIPAAVLFFGYIEVTPLSAALCVAYLAVSQSWLDRSTFLKSCSASFLLGLSFVAHGWAGVLLPTLIYLLILRPTSNRFIQWLSSLSLFTTPYAIIHALAAFHPDWVYGSLKGDSGDFQFAIFTDGLPVVFRDKCLTATYPNLCYRLFSNYQFIDIANYISRMSPILFALILLALVLTVQYMLQKKYSLFNSASLFWILVAMLSIGFLFYWEPSFGFERDWDLFAPSIITLTISLFGFALSLPTAFWHRADVRYSFAFLFSWNLATMMEYAFYLQPWLFHQVILKIFS